MIEIVGTFVRAELWDERAKLKRLRLSAVERWRAQSPGGRHTTVQGLFGLDSAIGLVAADSIFMRAVISSSGEGELTVTGGLAIRLIPLTQVALHVVV